MGVVWVLVIYIVDHVYGFYDGLRATRGASGHRALYLMLVWIDEEF